MDPLGIDEIAKFAGAVRQNGSDRMVISSVCTDSRTTRAGDLFVALRGDNFDGHQFVEQALGRGAVGAIVETNWSGNVAPGYCLLRADDTLVAYQQLAANYRASLSLKVVAITGSNGKTS